MPFINVKVAGEPLQPHQVAELQKGITDLMGRLLDKDAGVAAVLVEQTPAGAWSVGGHPVDHVAHIDALVSTGSNTPDQKAGFIAEAAALLKSVLGPGLSKVSYVTVHDVEMNSWGYDGRTQESRGRD